MVSGSFFRRMAAMLLIPASCVAASSQGPADTADGVFSRDVRTLSVRNADSFMSPPLIRLGTDDRIAVSFDIIGESHEYLRYRLLHCNADWQPSRLLESEYLDGFNEAEVADYAYSTNTFVHYVNYRIMIPNPDMSPLVGGNYLLQVYPESDPGEVLLQARFAVSENVMRVDGSLTSRTDKGFNTEFQQVGVAADASDMGGINPYQDIVVTVTQNNRPETTRAISHPLRVEGGVAVYEHDPALVFKAGNEYRRFETVRADYAGMHTDSVRFGASNWHAYLAADGVRADRDYAYDSTQHGRFLVDEYNSTDPDLGADYVTVHFTLDAPEVTGGEIYVDGDFTLHRFDESNRMRYDRQTGLYTAEIPLKQGSYNYQYVVVPYGGGYPDPSPVEGDKYETRNEYLVKVFLRTPGARADRLVGASLITDF